MLNETKRGSVPRGGFRVEWPTLALLGATYAAFGLLIAFHAALPWWALAPCGAFVVALFGSLQHEATHGHPTGDRLVDTLLVFPAIGLWLPFECYRESHIRHHNDANLTDPGLDPETYYLTAEAWARLAWPLRRLLVFNNTLLGRLTVGPAVSVVWTWWVEAKRVLAGDPERARAWAVHAVNVAAVLGLVVGVAGLPLWQYLILFAYPGLSLTLLRSYAEHRAEAEPGHRSAIVDAGPVFSLLFLNNNLHAVHHARPREPWYRLPAIYRAERDAVLAANGGYAFAGYGDIFRRYLLRGRGPLVHPLAG